jgi:hypothetical protein
MNIKDKYYIYLYKLYNKLIEQNKTDENNHKSILFDIAIESIDTAHAHSRCSLMHSIT